MASELPDEMLHEILSPVFHVPDDKFSSTEKPSPFSSVSQSSSEMLLVCKRWLRVAYPVFYRSAVIRSSGQAQALADALKTNENLGKYIKKLRLEGGYGSAIHVILTSAPNITDLYLSLFIWSDDSVSGLCRSLTAINPSRVILYDEPFDCKTNAKARQLALKVCECIRTWSNLVVFHFPYFVYPPNTRSYTLDSDSDDDDDDGDGYPIGYPIPAKERSTLIAKALKNARNLEIVFSPPGRWLPYALVTISENPELKSIRITSLCDGVGAPFLRALKLEANTRVRALVTFNEAHTENTSDNKALTFSYSLSKLEQAPEKVQDKIWSEILAYTLYIELRLIRPVDLRKTAINDWRRMLLFVSKAFHRRALPHFYNHPIILTPEALHQFSERLVHDTSLGLHLRSLFLWMEHPDESDTEVDKPANDDHEAMLNIISRAPRLRRVYGPDFQRESGALFFFLGSSSLSWEGFSLMADTAGSSLVAFEKVSIHGAVKLYTPRPLYSFTALQSLFWDCDVKFNVDDGVSLKDCFPCLESLRISSCDPSFLELLVHIDLQVLSRFAYTRWRDEGLENMLKRHGHKLYELELNGSHGLSIFDMCPTVNVFKLGSLMSDNEIGFRSSRKNLSLVKVTISAKTISFLRDDLYDKFFAGLNLKNFPALREISVEECYWTTDERKISKNPWVARSEALMRSGVTVTDKDGHPWRPRLKKSKR